jgi:acetolactate synthase I/III small subunit
METESKQLYTFAVLTENSPGILHRLTAIFTRRKINVESLNVAETGQQGVSRFTIEINISADQALKLKGQIKKIIEVIEVHAFKEEAMIYKQLAFYRVVSESISDIRQALNISVAAGAELSHVGEFYVVIEKIGSEKEIKSLYDQLKPLGLQEFVRSGRIAIGREQGFFTTKQN